MGYPNRRFSLLKRGVARLRKPQLRNMDVSIVIPFLDAAATLPACLAGLQAQDDFDGEVEWIFVDNGSTDDSAKILRAHPRVRLLFESRPGAYAAGTRSFRRLKSLPVTIVSAEMPHRSVSSLPARRAGRILVPWPRIGPGMASSADWQAGSSRSPGRNPRACCCCPSPCRSSASWGPHT